MHRLTASSLVVCAALFALAFATAPYSCDGGFEVYFWSGVAAVVALLALPWILRQDRSFLIRTGLSLGWGSAAVMIWVSGMFAASVRFFCRMF
jgi:hypothetical protein